MVRPKRDPKTITLGGACGMLVRNVTHGVRPDSSVYTVAVILVDGIDKEIELIVIDKCVMNVDVLIGQNFTELDDIRCAYGDSIEKLIVNVGIGDSSTVQKSQVSESSTQTIITNDQRDHQAIVIANPVIDQRDHQAIVIANPVINQRDHPPRNQSRLQNSISDAEIDVNVLETSLESISDLFKEYDAVQFKIEKLQLKKKDADEAQLAEESDKERGEVETQYRAIDGALRAIESLSISGDNYVNAIELLRKRF
ncbi:hypothetical protein GEV33_006795 [Tenebrio molitor]|uniref:Uncharacterized protein n=1 Tax=Tenebrio molitor TaxID=7067 RepID=A0A8J6HKJ6_TENMO|nr:hypothetical protein GEV33_006795 [Tenebrio molitor]